MPYIGEKESSMFPTFYHVPNTDDLIVNEHGLIINISTNDILKPEIFRGYPAISYEGWWFSVHRILAKTFLSKPGLPIWELQVNHKDGDKTNYSLDNLEWVTRRENVLHAYQTGLRDDNTPILVKDLRDDSITRHYSLQECARAFKTDASLIFHYLKPNNREKICWNFYNIIREGDEWPKIDKANIGKHRNGTAKPIMATDLVTNNSIIFESVGAAAEYYGHTRSALASFLLVTKDRPYYGRMYKFIDDPSLLKDKEVIKLQKTWKRTVQKPVPIEVTDIRTNITTKWDSSEDFAKSIGVLKNTLQKGILVGNGIWRNYKVNYLTT